MSGVRTRRDREGERLVYDEEPSRSLRGYTVTSVLLRSLNVVFTSRRVGGCLSQGENLPLSLLRCVSTTDLKIN